MSGRTRFFPRDFSEPEALSDRQIEGLKISLDGFRHLFALLNDVLPTGDAKDAAIAALAVAKRASDDAIRYHRPRLTAHRMVELFRQVEDLDQRVLKIVLNSYDYADVRNEPSIGQLLDFETSREVLKTGLMGRVYGACLYVNKRVPVGHVVVLSEKEDVEIGPDWVPAPALIEKI